MTKLALPHLESFEQQVRAALASNDLDGLRTARGFGGSQLTIEGAVLLAGQIRLFGRENGIPSSSTRATG